MVQCQIPRYSFLCKKALKNLNFRFFYKSTSCCSEFFWTLIHITQKCNTNCCELECLKAAQSNYQSNEPFLCICRCFLNQIFIISWNAWCSVMEWISDGYSDVLRRTLSEFISSDGGETELLSVLRALTVCSHRKGSVIILYFRARGTLLVGTENDRSRRWVLTLFQVYLLL